MLRHIAQFTRKLPLAMGNRLMLNSGESVTWFHILATNPPAPVMDFPAIPSQTQGSDGGSDPNSPLSYILKKLRDLDTTFTAQI